MQGLSSRRESREHGEIRFAEAGEGRRALTAHRGTSTAPADGAHAAASAGLRRSAIALFVWSMLYMAPHLYWALGGRGGGWAFKPDAMDVEHFRAANWAASAMLTAAGLVGLGLCWSRSRALDRALLVAAWGGASISAAHGLAGMAYRVLAIVGVVDIDGVDFDASKHGWVLWDLFVIEPWFFVEGVLFFLVGRAAVLDGRRRRWDVACACGLALATATAAVGLRV
jgi:hypothetical protein